MPFSPAAILPAMAFLGYWLLALFILIRRGVRDKAIWLLMGYLGALAIWTLSIVLPLTLPSAFSSPWPKIIAYAGVVASVALLLPARVIVRQWRNALWVLLIGSLGSVTALLFDPDLLPLIQVGPWQIGRQPLGQDELTLAILAFCRGFFVLGLLIVSWREYRQTNSPLHRNRLRYLILSVALTATGEALYTFGVSVYTQIAPLLKLGGATPLIYATLRYRLPVIKRVYRHSISYILITLITVIIFLVGILLPSVVLRTAPGLSIALSATAVAIVLALGYLPMRQAAQKLIDQFLSTKSYEYDRFVREYDQRVAGILDLERLTSVVIGVVDEAFGIERGALLVTEGGDDGIGKLRFQPYSGLGIVPDDIMEFQGSSPVLIHFRLKGQPLTQYELDFQPAFEKARQEERLWLRNMGMEVFVPIRAKERLIGVLAVGPKRSGDPYLEDELNLLARITDQTAVALENARFFGDLTMLNKVLSRAYTDLGRASRQLQEMDKLKSAFIGVITHELRSPFANIAFSLQLLERYGQEHLPPEQREQLEQLATGIHSARTMVDNLVTFAALLSKQGELHLGWLNFGQMVQDALVPLKPLAENNCVVLHIAAPDNLPSLYGDRERLSDAVYHLVHNAIKFNRPQGEVWVRSWATGDVIHFEVKDTGSGVPPDKLAKLWEGFTQMADPLRRGVEGLGLGLALVKYVVSAHSGEVWANSQEDVGSTFGFQVPFGKAND